MPVTVAAAEGSRAEHREASLGDGSRKVGIGIAVLSARTLEAQVGRPQRRRADVHRPGEGPDARQAVEQLHRRDAVEIDRQRVGLVPRAGIREINTVEKDHRLVERASADGDVGLRSLASAFADIDRRRDWTGSAAKAFRSKSGVCDRAFRTGAVWVPVMPTSRIRNVLRTAVVSALCADAPRVASSRIDIPAARTPIFT